LPSFLVRKQTIIGVILLPRLLIARDDCVEELLGAPDEFILRHLLFRASVSNADHEKSQEEPDGEEKKEA